MSEKLRVYADVREEPSGIPKMLESMGLIVIRRQLPTGDYIIPGEVIVERKTVSDYVNSLFDGRLFDQISRMSEDYSAVVLIVEGNIQKFHMHGGKVKQLYAALAALILDYDVKIVNSGGSADTATFIESLSRRSLESRGSRVVIHKKPRLRTLREWQLYIVSSLPGVGPKLANGLLENFKTIEGICTASIAELQKIVGESKASKIKEVLRTPYERGSRKSRSLEDYIG